MSALRITEIFCSIQGESTTSGLPTVFVRLTGCPLRCQYCDTAYAFSGGESFTMESIVAEVEAHGVKHVTVTGGEPLAQSASLELMRELSDRGFEVSLETSGALDIAEVDTRVRRIVDVKTPRSGEVEKNLITNFEHLNPRDELKFVICDRADYEWAIRMIDQNDLAERCPLLFSPSHQQLPASELAEWILADRLPVRLQIQVHKYLWGDEPGR